MTQCITELIIIDNNVDFMHTEQNNYVKTLCSGQKENTFCVYGEEKEERQAGIFKEGTYDALKQGSQFLNSEE